MRRILIALMSFAFALLVAGCGNKGPLVRPPATPDAVPPAPASSAAAPASASSPASTAPAYLSPPMPASSTSSSTGYPS